MNGFNLPVLRPAQPTTDGVVAEIESAIARGKSAIDSLRELINPAQATSRQLQEAQALELERLRLQEEVLARQGTAGALPATIAGLDSRLVVGGAALLGIVLLMSRAQ